MQVSDMLASLSEPIMAKPERLTYTVEEAAALLGIGRTLAYELAKQGKLPAVRLGCRLVVPKARLEKMLEEEAE